MSSFKKIREATTIQNHKISAYSNHMHLLSTPDTRYVYLLAGTHGDEPESSYVLNKVIQEDYFDDLPYQIIFVPEVNPDGLRLNTRVNANNVDLNRNLQTNNWVSSYSEERYFPGISPNSEVETKFLIELFKDYRPQFIISFHSWKRILNYNLNPQAIRVAQLVAEYNKYPISDDIGYSTPGSLGSYVDDVLHCGIITYELPVVNPPSLTMEDIWKENQAGLKAALESLKTTYD
jgi:protein MpaA